MNKKIEHIKFNLTKKMSLELIKFNEIKKELNKLKKLYNLDKSEDTLLEIKKKEEKLKLSKERFIMEFRLNNKEEIDLYLRLKNNIDSK